MSGLTGDQLASLLYLSLLGAAVVGWFLVEARPNRSKMLQQASIWALIFFGMIAIVGLWSDIRRHSLSLPRASESGDIILPRGWDGHFQVVGQVNGTQVNFLIDTGASDTVLTRTDAARIGIDVDALAFLGTASTANGDVRTAAIRLDTVEIGPIQEQNLRAVVNDGELGISLLGMSFLSRFTEITMTDDQMILRR